MHEGLTWRGQEPWLYYLEQKWSESKEHSSINRERVLWEIVKSMSSKEDQSE